MLQRILYAHLKFQYDSKMLRLTQDIFFILQTAPLANIKDECYTEAIKKHWRCPICPVPKEARTSLKTVKATVDFAAQITEKQAAKEAAAAEIASITANIDALKADLKTKKASLNKLDKELVKLESKKKDAETKAAESAKKAEAEDVLKKLLASGMTADEILAKLK